MASMNSRYHPVGPPATSLSKVPHHPSTGGKSAISMRSGHSTSSSSAAAPAPPSSRRRSSTQDTRKTKQARTHVDDDASSAHYSHEDDPAGLADGFFDANDDAVEKEAAPVQLPGLEPFKQPAPAPRAPVPKRSPHWKNSEFMPVVNFGDEIDARLQAVYVPERETFPFGEMEQLHKQINLMAMSVQGSRALHEYYTETSNDIEAKVKALLLRPSNAASNVYKFIQEFTARKTPSLGDIKIFATEIMARTAGAESAGKERTAALVALYDEGVIPRYIILRPLVERLRNEIIALDEDILRRLESILKVSTAVKPVLVAMCQSMFNFEITPNGHGSKCSTHKCPNVGSSVNMGTPGPMLFGKLYGESNPVCFECLVHKGAETHFAAAIADSSNVIDDIDFLLNDGFPITMLVDAPNRKETIVNPALEAFLGS